MFRLYRYPEQGILGGVCEGIGRQLEIDPSLIRIFWALLIICGGFGAIIYLLAWILLPAADEENE